MSDIKLGGRTFNGVTAVQMDTTDGETVVFGAGGNVDQLLQQVVSPLSTFNLLDNAEWELGYYTSDGLKAGPLSGGNQEILSSRIPVEPGRTYHIIYSVPAGQATSMWYRYIWYTADGTFIRANGGTVIGAVDGDRAYYTTEIIAPENAYYFAVSCRSFCDNGQWWTSERIAKDLSGFNAIATSFAKRTIRLCADGQESRDDTNVRIFPEYNADDFGKEMRTTEYGFELRYPDHVYRNTNIRAVNHRGYNIVAPENTLAAFRMSKKMGFEYVETDVRLTSDGVPVIIHNDTVDAVSNGTGAVAEMTLEQLKALDFGSWKSSEYAGEKIPTFEEFILLCKRLGLKPYIEIKAEAVPTDDDAKKLTDIVERYGMRNNVTWISYGLPALMRIKERYPYGRIGFIVDVIDETAITNVTSLKADTNDVFLSAHHTTVTAENVSLCVAANVPLEVWTVNEYCTLLTLDPYVSGYTSDSIVANVAFADSVL